MKSLALPKQKDANRNELLSKLIAVFVILRKIRFSLDRAHVEYGSLCLHESTSLVCTQV